MWERLFWINPKIQLYVLGSDHLLSLVQTTPYPS